MKILKPSLNILFEINRDEWHEELGERLDAAGKLLYRSVELDEESVSIGKKMLGNQEETIDGIRGLRQNLKSYMEERFDRLELR